MADTSRRRFLQASLALYATACAGPRRAQPSNMSSASAAPPTPAPQPSEPPKTLLRLVETIPTATGLSSPNATFAERWLAVIDGAKQQLALSHFYLSEQAPSALSAVLVALLRAHDRGVRVRLLLDAAMAKTYPQPLATLEKALQVRRIDVAASMGGVQHAKYLVVDDHTLLLGSANLDWRALEHIHELGIELTAPPLARALLDIFDSDWALAAGEAPPPAQADWSQQPVQLGDLRIRLVASPRGHLPHPPSWELPQLEQLVAGAQQRLRLQLLSLQPSFRDGRPFDRLERALLQAVGRGVAVQVLLSHWECRADHIVSVKRLREQGVDVRLCTVPQHPAGFIPFARVIHAKYLVVDERRSWIGTSNWSGDYFEHSRNVGVVVEGRSLALQLDAVFERMWQSRFSAPVDPMRDYPQPQLAAPVPLAPVP